MKRTKKFISFFTKITLVILLLACLLNCFYVWARKKYPIYFYEYIRYNGQDYFFTETQRSMGYWDVSEKIPVMLIDDDGTILRKDYDYAYKLQGDENCDFLYFDSAVYTKIISLRSPYYVIKDGKIKLP